MPVSPRHSLPARPPPPLPPAALQEEFVNGSALRLDCNCRGDLALRHRDCVMKWVQVKGSNVCELCKAEIRNIPAPPPRPAEADLPQLDEAYFNGEPALLVLQAGLFCWLAAGWLAGWLVGWLFMGLHGCCQGTGALPVLAVLQCLSRLHSLITMRAPCRPLLLLLVQTQATSTTSCPPHKTLCLTACGSPGSP